MATAPVPRGRPPQRSNRGWATAAVHAPDLRLIVVTDAGLAGERGVRFVVRQALDAGAPAIQLRMKGRAARELFDLALELRAWTRAAGALLFVNDRMDVALAAGADGVHLGPDDLPVAAARARAPADFLIGFSTDDPDRARAAQAQGANYIGCGAVFGTRSKDVSGERIGTERLDAVARAVDIPVVGIGGVTPTNVDEVADTAAAGAAVIAAVMAADQPAAAVRSLLQAFPSRNESP